jgi:hypothetical protein
MNQEFTKLVVAEGPKAKEVIVSHHKMQFEFKSFQNYQFGKEISAEMEIPEIEAVW